MAKERRTYLTNRERRKRRQLVSRMADHVASNDNYIGSKLSSFSLLSDSSSRKDSDWRDSYKFNGGLNTKVNGTKASTISTDVRLRPDIKGEPWILDLRLALQKLQTGQRPAFERLAKESEGRAAKLQRLRRPAWKSKLSEEMREQATEVLEKNGIIISQFNLDISHRDLHTLTHGQWLNDEVINFYAALINERAKNNTNLFPKVYMHNTHFFSTLISSGYDKVRRWTKRAKVDIFALDYLIVPIHLGMHWTCCVVDFLEKTIDYYDSLLGIYDCFTPIREYIQKESLDKKGVEFDLSDWKSRSLEDIPRQENGYDCGVFACQIAEHISRNGMLNYTQADMSEIRLQMIWEITNAELVHGKDKEIIE